MFTFTLNGAWSLRRADQTEAVPATVPGSVYTDLLAAGLLDDPYYRDNELKTLWIAETDWVYSRAFDLPADALSHERVLLRCAGLDTLAEISLNGQPVAHTDNMFRTYEFDVKGLLRTGANEITVRFNAPMPYLRAKEQERFLPAWGVGQHKRSGGGWLRKEPCNFGWDWGPMLTTSGIWRDIELIAFDPARLTDVLIMQDHGQAGRVGLTVRVEVERASAADLSAVVRVSLNGQTVVSEQLEVAGDTADVHLEIADPQLWWPNGLGAQPLYEVTVELLADGTRLIDTVSKRIGLRELRLDRHDDQWGESFQFVCNGVPFFAKGANWIPADTFATRVTRADYTRLLNDAAAANMNMLRVWGGGIYEEDIFYDLCDELGLCIWQDFMFSCATYPTFDAAFMANVKAEAEDNVRRIRHHPCMALWCGNNELEQGLVGDSWTEHTMSWEDYKKLFDVLLPEVVNRLDPQRDYWPCSPHSPRGNRNDWINPNWGDAHLWAVWHSKEPFEWYRTCEHRFNSEFGFQSFPEPKTAYLYTLPEDRNITSPIMEHHQRSGTGNATIMHYMLDWFRLPTSFENVLWASQILQGMAMKYAVEHWRRNMPRGMGTLYWQINDCWPVASWSSIDSVGRWKALHYMARRFYAPLLISGLEDAAKGTVEIHITSDRLEVVNGTVTWRLTNTLGVTIASGDLDTSIAPNGSQRVTTLDLKPQLEQDGARSLLLWLTLKVDGVTVSNNLVTFARPKQLDLRRPDIAVTVQPDADGAYQVTLSSPTPALWVWLELREADARYSDNFIYLEPGVPAIIEVRPAAPLSVDAFRAALLVRSLVDTY